MSSSSPSHFNPILEAARRISHVEVKRSGSRDRHPLKQRNPSIQKSTSIKSTTQSQTAIVKQGYMIKQGGSHKNWKKRWFSLQKGGGDAPRLFYYKNLNENIKGVEPLNCIYLDSVKINKTHGNRFEIDCSSRTFFFRTETDEDCTEWVKALLELISNNKIGSEEPEETQKIEHEGYLVKQGNRIKTKKKRWFVLRGKKLLYYKDESKFSPLGIIDLDTCLKVTRSATPNSFEVNTINRNFPLVADSKEETDKWIEVLQTTVERSSILLSYSDSATRLDHSIFSSEEDSEEEDKIPEPKVSMDSNLDSQLASNPTPPSFEKHRPLSSILFVKPLSSENHETRRDSFVVIPQDIVAISANQKRISYLNPEIVERTENHMQMKSLQPSSFVVESTFVVESVGEKERDTNERDPLQDLINVLDDLVSRSSLSDIVRLDSPEVKGDSSDPGTPVQETAPPIPQANPEEVQKEIKEEPKVLPPLQSIKKDVDRENDSLIVRGKVTIDLDSLSIPQLSNEILNTQVPANQVACISEITRRIQKDEDLQNFRMSNGIANLIKCVNGDVLPVSYSALNCLSATLVNEVNRDEFCKLQGVQSVCKILNFPHPSAVHVQALRCIINLTCTDRSSVQSNFRNNDGLNCVSKFLKSEKEEIKLFTLQALTNITSDDSNSKALIRMGVVPELVKLLKVDDRLQQRHCCFVLANICVDDEAKEQLRLCNGLEMLVNLILSPYPEVQLESCKAITNSSTLEGNKEALRSAGAIPLLVDLLGQVTVDQAIPQGQRLLLYTLWAICNLATTPENQAEIGAKGAIPFINVSLLHEDDIIKHRAAWAIANLSLHEKNRERFEDTTPLCLINLMGSDSEEICAQAVKAVANLSLDDNQRAELGKLGACSSLIEILNKPTNENFLHDHCIVALLNLSLDEYCRDAIRYAGGLDRVLSLLKNWNEGKLNNLPNVLKLFTNLAFSHQNRQEFLQMGCLNVINEYISSKNPEISSLAKKACVMLGQQ